MVQWDTLKVASAASGQVGRCWLILEGLHPELSKVPVSSEKPMDASGMHMELLVLFRVCICFNKRAAY